EPWGNTLEEARGSERACDAFEAAWRAAGVPPRIEDFLGAADGAHRLPLLVELVALDAHHRRRRGRAVSAEDYRGRFPDLAPALLADALAPEGTTASGSLDDQKSTGNDLAVETRTAGRAIRAPRRAGSAFDEETRALLRRRLLHVHLVAGVSLLALII